MSQSYVPRLSSTSELHRLAEALWEERSPLHKGRCADPQALIHELGVQRFELELKNGDLSAAYNEIWRILERYTELYDFAPVAYFTFLTNGRIGETNFAAATLLGVERPQLIGASIFDFIDEPHLAAFQAFLQEIGKAPASSRHLESGLRKRDGTRLHVRMNGVCGDFVPNHGRSIRIAMFDTTEREGARAALQAQRDAEASYFESAPLFMMVLNTQGRIARINRKGLELLRCEREQDLLDRDWFSDCLPARVRRRLQEEFASRMQGRGADPGPQHIPVVCRDGSRRFLDLRASLLRDAGAQIIGLVCVGEAADPDPGMG